MNMKNKSMIKRNKVQRGEVKRIKQQLGFKGTNSGEEGNSIDGKDG
jgi:hypothetical protein